MKVRVALVLAVAGAVVLFAATRVWQTTTPPRNGLLVPAAVAHTGSELAPWLPALGVIALAGAGAVLATRGRLRQAVGVLVTLVAAGIVAAAAVTLGEPDVALRWPLLTIAAALAVAGAGVVTVRRGAAWPGMSARYDRAPAGRGKDLWDALDRGEDPTRDQ